ncbi:uncharacterized protein LOC126994734 [Eriocheir sinensis]|uniref:uncharacterized protein LOC126994734 n=1 Tax=Eriocheir sinensis TaxID=95602 RepID=UPI0021C9DDF3|nr:uncharacterized protein LOC126994734 [Eriocheir sinensis]
MGCSESKDLQHINPSDAHKKLESSLEGLEVVRMTSSASSSGQGSSVPHTPEEKARETTAGALAIFDNIPTNDLGESLDCRRGAGAWHHSTNGAAASLPTTSTSSRSVDSSDSGIYDLDEDYSFVITENSPQELVRRVEADFTPIENLDLTVTGKQCPRLLSGYQKARQEEQAILASLREDGFIATSKQRAGAGIAFEIIEATPATESASSSKFKPKDFLPENTRQHLESQRNRFNLKDLTHADVRMKMEMADRRRQAELESKKEKMAAMSKTDSAEGKRMFDLREKLSQQKGAALEKRRAHLRELRDKLQAQNSKAKQVKLKKMINGPPVPVPLGPTRQLYRANQESFFD